MKLKDFEEAGQFLAFFIPKSLEKKFSGEKGFERAKYFLDLLGNPQDKIKVVHVAGTSGKGSTAYLISSLLGSLKLKVGLHLSPHLLDVRERTQINNQLIQKEKFVTYLNELIPVIEKLSNSSLGKPTYFEVTTALAFYIFWKEKVDYAVIETGLGGLYDATNVVNSEDKLVVLTKIGLDHTEILGKKISQIALQKAEIIHNNNIVVSPGRVIQAQKVIEKIAQQRNAQVHYVKKGINFFPKEVNEKGETFNFKFQDLNISKIQLNMLGSYQIENCSLALTVVILVCKRDKLIFDEVSIKHMLEEAHFPGRFDKFIVTGKTLIIDGAHNPQKMCSLLGSLKKIYPKNKFTFLLAFKQGKDYKTMLKLISPLANMVVFTSFFLNNQDLLHLSEDPSNVSRVFRSISNVPCKIIDNSTEALDYVLKQESITVVTGSLYLLSQIYPVISSLKE